MTPADREHLRRIAYGPDATAEERAAAASELRQRDEQARVAREALRHEPVATAMEQDETISESAENSEHLIADDDDDDDDEEQSLWQRKIRIGRLIPIALGSLLLGVVGVWGVSGQFDTTAATVGPTQQPESNATEERWSVSLITGPGNVAAANSWFDFPATPADVFPITELLTQVGIEQSQVRVVLNDDGQKIWIAKQGTIGFCLGGYDSSEGGGQFICATVQDFEQSGVVLMKPGYAAWWGGEGIVTSR